MLLSIIIPVYNTEKFLEKCVISCETQDIPKDNYELIIVNDGSTDNSSNITKSLSEEFSNIVLYYQSNAGLSSARNVGIKLAKGDYIMFVDSDDWIAENCLGKICDNIKTNRPDALAICSANVYGDCISLRNSYNSGSIIRGRDFLKKEQVPDGAPFAIWNRNFFEENHFKFKEGIFHEDSELIPKVYYIAESVSCINDIIYFVYQNPNSITRSVNYQRAFDYIEHVCVSLNDFYDFVDDEYKSIFDNRISIYINNAFCVCKKASPVIKNNLSESMFRNRFLWTHLKRSNVLKYKIEYYLFRLFPRKSMVIYNVLKSFSIK